MSGAGVRSRVVVKTDEDGLLFMTVVVVVVPHAVEINDFSLELQNSLSYGFPLVVLLSSYAETDLRVFPAQKESGC